MFSKFEPLTLCVIQQAGFGALALRFLSFQHAQNHHLYLWKKCLAKQENASYYILFILPQTDLFQHNSNVSKIVFQIVKLQESK